MLDRGLDLAHLDATSDAETAAFNAHYAASHGAPLPAYDFWMAMDPGQVKRHRLQARWTADAEGRSLPLHGTIAFLHLYAIYAYADGIRYEVSHAHSLGSTRAAVLETLALAFMHSGPRGMHAASDGARDLLDRWPVDSGADILAAFPPGWNCDVSVLANGFDYTTPTWTASELSALTDWYRRHLGEVPAYVDFLRPSRPGILKAWWARLEGAMRGALPIQMLPFLMIHFNVARAVGPGIREGVLLGRSFGLTESQIFEAIGWGALYGGPAAVSVAAQATEGLLDASRIEVGRPT
jgi:hypothetical protein